MKILKTKRIFLYSVYRALRETPPKEFPTTEEIKVTIDNILPALKEVSIGFTKALDGVDEVNREVRKKKITDKVATEKREKLANQFNEYNDEHGEDIVSIEFEDEHFKVFQEQFDRQGWGQTFLNSIEDYNELSTAFEEVSSEKKKEK